MVRILYIKLVKLHLTVISLLFLCFNGFSQTYNSFQPVIEKDDLAGAVRWPDDRNYIEGTPYLFDDFISGNLYYRNELLHTQLPIRVNLNSGEIEYLRNDSVLVLNSYNQIDRIVVNGELLLYLDGKHNSIVSGIVKTWSSEFPTVLTKMHKYYYSKTVLPYAEVKPRRFERKDNHFVWISEDQLMEVTSTKKLVKVLGHSKELLAYAKKQKISTDNPVELMELLDYYKHLTEERQ